METLLSDKISTRRTMKAIFPNILVEEQNIKSEFLQLSRQGRQPTAGQWEELQQCLREDNPGVMLRLESRDVSLTYQEIQICMLTLLQLIPIEQAALLGVSRQRITNLRASINQKLFNKKSARNLDAHLIELGANM